MHIDESSASVLSKYRERLAENAWLNYVIYTVIYVLAMLFSFAGFYYITGLLLAGVALYLYAVNAYVGRSLVDLKAVFSLSWIGGEGISSLQLSRLQTDWETETWLCFYLAYVCFCVGYDFYRRKRDLVSEEREPTKVEMEKNERVSGRLLICIAGLAVCSILCFCLEAVVVGYIPILSSEPHAYSYFHVSGVHYFTISCILIPGLSLLYWKSAEKIGKCGKILLVFGNITAFAIPIICVSRFQLLFAVGFAAVIYLLLNRRIPWKLIAAGIVVMIPAYVLLTVARNHDVEYLNGIFEMKNSNIPIFVTQPYIYVANNYANFNCLVRDLAQHTCGIRMLFPVLALTGLKFVFPELVSTPLYITKTELTTLTVFYDAYYDFGIPGIVVFALILGVAAGWLAATIKRNPNPVFYMFYGQMAIYLGLSFFTTWFSNPTTWFWVVLTFMMYLFVGYNKEGKYGSAES